MPTSLKSQAGSSRTNIVRRTQRGFTLIELLISISIIAILSAVSIMRFSVFDGTIVLKSTAFEMAANVREAQVFAVSVLGDSFNFDQTYGMSFVENSKTYVLFQPVDPDQQYPSYDYNDPAVRVYTLPRDIQVIDLCITTSGGSDCDINQLDVSFRRPNFSALFSAGSHTSDVESAQIKLKSASNDGIWDVEIGLLGYISVTKE